MTKVKLLGFSAVALIAAVTVLWRLAFPSYSYRYRLTLQIEADGQVYSDARVIEITWNCGPPLSYLGRCSPTVYGQAPLIDLGSRGAVIAALSNGDYGRAGDGTYSAIWIAPRAFGKGSSDDELPDLPKLKGTRPLAPDNMPQLIWLPSIADPSTVRRLPPWEIPTLLGPSVSLKGLTVEMTNDPVVIDINKKLPWFSDFAARQKSGPIIGKPGQFLFTYHQVVRD